MLLPEGARKPAVFSYCGAPYKARIILIQQMLFTVHDKTYSTAWFFVWNSCLLMPLEELGGRLEKQVAQLMEYYDVPGVGVALIRGGEVVWSQSFGFAHREAEKSVTEETKLELKKKFLVIVGDEASNEGRSNCTLRHELQLMHSLSIHERRSEQTGIPQKILSRLYSERRKLCTHG